VAQRTAPHRSSASMPPALAEKYNAVLTACGTTAARRWLPQALKLPTVFHDLFVARKTFAVVRNDGNRAYLGYAGCAAMLTSYDTEHHSC